MICFREEPQTKVYATQLFSGFERLDLSAKQPSQSRRLANIRVHAGNQEELQAAFSTSDSAGVLADSGISEMISSTIRLVALGMAMVIVAARIAA